MTDPNNRSVIPRRRKRKKRRCNGCIKLSLLLCVCIALIVGFVTCNKSKENTETEETHFDSEVETENFEYETDLSGYTSEDELSAMNTQEESVVVANHDAVQSMINDVGEEYGATGIQVAVIENGIVTDSFAYGWATIGEEPMTADHKMRVASISKVIVGMTAMLLQEDGIVDLDEDIGVYWNTTAQNPMYPNHAITIRNILHHTSSIMCYGDDYSTDYNSVLARLSYGYSDLEPGSIESYYYNNYAFRVLGMTLELAANQGFDEILRDKLFSAMDIDGSFASGDIQDTDKLVTLYESDGEIGRSVETSLSIHMPDVPGADGTYFAGGLTISSVDLAKIVALLAADGQYDGMQLMSVESVEEMETYMPEPLSDGSYMATPLFYWTNIYGRDELYYHTGSAYGVDNCISYDPNTGDGIVVLTTGTDGASDKYDIGLVCSVISEYIYSLIQD